MCVVGRHLEDLDRLCTGEIKNFSTSPAPWDTGTNCIFIVFFIWRYAIRQQWAVLACPPGAKQSTWQLKNGPSWWQLHLCFAPVTKGLHFICPSVASRTGCAPPGATADDLNGRPAAYKNFLMKSYSVWGRNTALRSYLHPMSLLYCDSTHATQRLNY